MTEILDFLFGFCLFVLLFSLRGGFRSYFRAPLTCVSDCFGLELLLLPISAVILML